MRGDEWSIALPSCCCKRRCRCSKLEAASLAGGSPLSEATARNRNSPQNLQEHKLNRRDLGDQGPAGQGDSIPLTTASELFSRRHLVQGRRRRLCLHCQDSWQNGQDCGMAARDSSQAQHQASTCEPFRSSMAHYAKHWDFRGSDSIRYGSEGFCPQVPPSASSSLSWSASKRLEAPRILRTRLGAALGCVCVCMQHARACFTFECVHKCVCECTYVRSHVTYEIHMHACMHP